MTSFIVRLRSPWLRVPLWSLWFPFALLDNAVETARNVGPLRLLRAEFWALSLGVFIVGIEGVRE